MPQLLALVAAGHGVTTAPALLLEPPRPGITVTEQELGISRTIHAVSRTVSEASVSPLIELLRAGP